jgi:hypothetical protein
MPNLEPPVVLAKALHIESKWFGHVVFGYHLPTDMWHGCGNGLWYQMQGLWPPQLDYQRLEVEGMSFRVVSVRGLDALGIEGDFLPVPFVTPR